MALPIARDLMSEGIRVNTILPGVFETPMVAMMPQNVKDALAAAVPFPKRLGQRRGICPAGAVHGRERLFQRRICPARRRDPDGAALGEAHKYPFERDRRAEQPGLLHGSAAGTGVRIIRGAVAALGGEAGLEHRRLQEVGDAVGEARR